MTIRLLAARGDYPSNAIVTLDAGTEAGLIAAKLASSDLTDGVPYVAPVVPNRRYTAQVEVDSSGAVIGLVGPDGKAIALGSSSGVASGIVSHRPQGGLINALYTGSTYANMIGCKRAFQGVRIAFHNYSTSATMGITAKVAPCPTLANNGTGLTYTPVTFDGAVSVTVPMATTVNGQVVPALAWSDLIPIRSVARTDVVDADPLLYMRTFSADSIPLGTVDVSRASWIDGQHHIGSVRNATDQITVTTTAMAPQSTGLVSTPYAQIDFYTGGKTARIGAFGDSLTNGILSGGGGDYGSWPVALQKAMRDIGFLNISVANWGTTGQKRDVSSAIFQSVAAKTKPDIAVLWNYSVNSSTDFGGAEKQFRVLASDLEFCRVNGIKPVIVAMHPNDLHAAWTRQFVEGWGLFLDLAQVLQTSAVNGTIAPENTYDNTHLTLAGNTKFAAYAAPLIAKLL
jgi:hypothetical protein